MADEAKGLKDHQVAEYPVYLYEEGVELPEKGGYYLVAKTGIYFHKNTKVGNAFVKVKGIPFLQEPDLEFRLKLPKVPGRIIGQALTFFRKVFEKYHAEAYLTLMFSSKLNQYRLWCPKQKVSMSSVDYDRTDQVPPQDRPYEMLGVGENRRVNTEENDWQLVGTIHSHCDFNAYHSDRDISDEATLDGIHIILGHVNKSQFSMAVSIAINEIRETLEPEQSCGVVRATNRETLSSQFMSCKKDAFYFNLELSEDDSQWLVADAKTIETEWMPKVETVCSEIVWTPLSVGFVWNTPHAEE